MDERYLPAAARYIKLNPVRAKLVTRAGDYPWSSAKAHLRGRDDGLVRVSGVGKIVKNWREFMSLPVEKELADELREHSSTGRPLGGEGFLKTLEAVSGIPAQTFIKKKPCPKPKK